MIKYPYPVTVRFDCQLFRLKIFQCTVLLCKKPARSARLGLMPLTLQIPAYYTALAGRSTKILPPYGGVRLFVLQASALFFTTLVK